MIFGFPLSRPSPIEILPSSTLMLEPQIDRTPFEAYCCFCGATQALNKQPKHQPVLITAHSFGVYTYVFKAATITSPEPLPERTATSIFPFETSVLLNEKIFLNKLLHLQE